MQVDERGEGHLDCVETMIALRAVNPLLTDADEEYIYTVSFTVIVCRHLLLSLPLGGA